MDFSKLIFRNGLSKVEFFRDELFKVNILEIDFPKQIVKDSLFKVEF
jgi:hypothetical protein